MTLTAYIPPLVLLTGLAATLWLDVLFFCI